MHGQIDIRPFLLFTFSGVLLLKCGGRGAVNRKNAVKCMKKVKNSIQNKLRVIYILLVTKIMSNLKNIDLL